MAFLSVRKHQIAVKISDVKLYLTQTQYILLMKLVQSIPKILVASPEGNAQVLELALPVSSSDSSGSASHHVMDLEPELHVADGIRAWTTVDLVASVKMVKLHLYDSLATREGNLEDHGIARFALNDSSLRYKSTSDGAAEAQVVLKSFTMSNTRPGGSKFREIIPAADHNRNQFMVLYTMSGSSSVALLTVDSPHVILAIEPVIALLEFFMSAFQQDAPVDIDHASTADSQRESPQSRLDFRLDLHDVSISVLENDEDANSQALRLYIDQILLSQQVRPFFFVSPQC
jgi:vacuolar protein sorting-associated protein 13A/C